MIRPIVSTSGIAYPDDLTLLKRVYDQICREKLFPHGSPEAANLARQAMSLFRRGIFAEDILVAELRAWSEQDLRR